MFRQTFLLLQKKQLNKKSAGRPKLSTKKPFYLKFVLLRLDNALG
jgi:hypothetical protein